MKNEHLNELYKILVKNPFERFKASKGGAYSIKEAYILLPNEWSDPKVWFNGHICYCQDVDDYVYNIVLEDHGKEEANKFYEDPKFFNKYCRKYLNDIKNYIEEIGEKITLQEAWNKIY